MTLKLDVYRQGTKRAPVILWVHGGGMYVGSKDVRWDLVSFLAEAMMLRGYVFVSMNYRLNPEWEEQDAFRETITDAASDVASAVTLSRKRLTLPFGNNLWPGIYLNRTLERISIGIWRSSTYPHSSIIYPPCCLMFSSMASLIPS